MNILILNWRDPKNPNAGGAEIVTHEHAKAWLKAGHKVTWFASSFKNAKDIEEIDGVSIIRRGYPVIAVQVKAFLWYVFEKHENYDLIVDQFHGVPFFTPLYVRKKKLGFIHEVAKNVWKLNPWPSPFNQIPYFIGTLFEPWIFKIFYKNIPFMTVSQSTKDDLIEWEIKSKNISVIHNGSTIPQIKVLPMKEKNKTLIFLGAISIDKGILDALDVFYNLKQIDPNWQFWIVGRSDIKHKKLIIDLSKKMEIDKNLKFWGYVNENKKFELLGKAHLLLNPSVREGWGLVIIEAASQQTPAAVYEVAGLKDSVRNDETGLIIKKRDAKQMAKEIEQLMNDKKKYSTMQKNAILWSKKFTWEKATKESLTLISSL